MAIFTLPGSIRLSIRPAPPASRSVAQPGSALDWGSRGRGFESRRSDHDAGGFCQNSQPYAGPSLDPGLRRGERCLGAFSIFSARTGEGRYPGDHPQPYAGLSLDPGLRRGERFRGRFSIFSAHTGVGRYPGDHPHTSAGPSLDPGLRRGERCLGRDAIKFDSHPGRHSSRTAAARWGRPSRFRRG